jgi:hypothetical protein
MATNKYLIYKPMKKEVDMHGQYTIMLLSGIALKGTKEEIELFIKNLQRMISDES